MNNILRVERLSKRFGDRAVLSDLSFDVARDSITVVLGTNGAGKSTLLRCILGTCAADSGSISVLGHDALREQSAVRALLGYVPDQPDVYGWMTARDLFHFLESQYPAWCGERAAHLLERLRAPRDVRFDAMSRGEAAKVMLAAALAPAPQLLMLDEPFSRVAPPVRDEVLAVFLEEAPISGGAALVTTHDLEVAARIADRVIVLDHGRLRAVHDIDELMESDASAQSLPERLRSLYPTACEQAACEEALQR
jgi:ABC-2 type transport system ATP-binding protein